MKLVSIPKEKYSDYRLDIIFEGYKWDPQFLDNNTIAKHALVISESEAEQRGVLTEKLAAETVAAETAFNGDLSLTKPLSLPRQLKKLLHKMKNYDASRHTRLMRFDFHPVVGGGFAVSEVNSDVPGGFAESTLMPYFAAKYIGNKDLRYIDFGEALSHAVQKKINAGGTVAMVHCTCYTDDRQVMQYLGDKLEKAGRKVVYVASDHLKFENGQAFCVLDGHTGKVDFIFRFTPVEWLLGVKPKTWPGYFDTTASCCNHPVAVYAQTKRFPLAFDTLEKRGVDLSTWRALLPETLDVKHAKNKQGFIYKPAAGRVGEGISIKTACTKDEYEKILKDVKRRPKTYVAQKMFVSQPLVSDEGESFHLCLGSYSLGASHAGFYARLSRTPRIDSNACDIPVLIERDTK